MPRVLYPILFVLFASFAGTSRAQDFLPELVKRIKPSAVAIETFDARGNTLSRGSGFFIAMDRVITNRHVIERAARVEIHLLNGKKYPVKGVLAVDGEGDLALLAVDAFRSYRYGIDVTHAPIVVSGSWIFVATLVGFVLWRIVGAVRQAAR